MDNLTCNSFMRFKFLNRISTNIIHLKYIQHQELIALDCILSYVYAKQNGPFPLGEEIISKFPHYSYAYSRWVLNGPFPLGEPAISTDPHYSYMYAKHVLNGRFQLGEKEIAKETYIRSQYVNDVLLKDFYIDDVLISSYKKPLHTLEILESDLNW